MMKAKNLLLLAGCACMLYSCSNEENVYDPNWVKEQYASNFEAEFGKIDPAQTWNTATSRTANISVALGDNADYTIKMYTSDPRSTYSPYLLAKYQVKDGSTNALQFDMPASLNTVWIACVDKNGYYTIQETDTNNPTVTFSSKAVKGTRDASDTNIITRHDQTKDSADKEKWYREFTKEDVKDVYKQLPDKDDNSKNGAHDFKYVPKGSFYIYPVYSVADNYNTIGIYYEENGETVEIPLWYNQINETNDSQHGIQVKYEWGWKSWGAKDPYDKNPFEQDDIEKVRSKEAIEVNLPEGTKFGMYINNGNETFYSEKEKNTDDYSHASTFVSQLAKGEGKECIFVGFEDMKNGGDKDFNDVIVCIVGNPYIPVIEPEDESMEYRIAYEDLGSIDDFDFNDVVLGIKHVSGETTSTVTLLAAGGTLNTSVSYNNQVIFEEVHAAFGVPTSTMVNTGSVEKESVAKTINVEKGFSISKDASKFKIMVTRNDGQTEITVPSESGKAPQAFVVSQSNWEWPAERQRITNKYSKFADWIKDVNANNWYEAEWK